ncbi:hypothetical protein [Haladaptatus sp. NG-SE-30]
MSIDTESTNPKTLLRQVGGLRTVAFYAIVVMVIGLMAAFLGDTLVFFFTGWFDTNPGVHHLHELIFVTMLWSVLIGLVMQIYKPEKRVAAMQQALLVNIVITGANVLTGFFFPPALLLGGLLVTAVLLHPAGRDVLRVRTAGSVSPLLVGMVALAGIPLAVYAANQYLLQASGNVHAQLGHYADMVTYTGLILLLGLLAGLQPTGWRVPLWSAAGLAVVLGLSSAVYPTLPSSAGLLWGGLAILWGIGFIVAGEVSRWKEV